MTRFLLALLVLLVAVAPARAVVGGQPVDPATVPWFASVGGCGGTLVAPDRVLTAGHCVMHQSLSKTSGLSAVVVGGVARDVTGFAMHPAWRHANGPHNVLDDVAIVQLAQPVTEIAAVPLGDTPAKEARIVGTGRSTVPGSGASEGLTFGGGLREAVLRPITDRTCARAFRHHAGNAGERFDAARMLCATDVDGRAPLSSGCNGDSGGPLYAGTPQAPVLLGVVSWGGARCGADHLPSVFAQVSRYRAFIADPSPTWAPATASPAQITGTRRVGGRLTCTATGFAAPPTRIAVFWQRQGGGRPKTVSHARSYRVTRADRGRKLVCAIEASNDGGIADVPFGTSAIAKISR
jgi:secreted trypsin-like serine protease